MAHIYVDSNAGGAGTGADWANAYTTLKAAAENAGTAAGDNIWVAHDHAESTAASVTITFKGTAASPTTVICVNKAGTVPPVATDLRTTATVTTTGNNNLILSRVSGGSNYLYGIIFNAGSGANATVLAVGVFGAPVSGVMYFKNCSLRKLGTSAQAEAITLQDTNSAVAQKVVLDGTTVQFGNTGDRIVARGHVEWKNTASAIAGATIPTVLFTASSTRGGVTVVDGVDLSAIAGTIFEAGVGDRINYLINCKLHASATIAGTPTQPGGMDAIVVNSDGGDTNYRTEKYQYMGTQTVETTIVRTGGASDGTTPISWKIVTTANSEWVAPFESLPITIWDDTPGAKTLTVYGYENEGDVPTNREIWIEVEYLGTSGFPLSSRATSGAASFLATASNYTEDTTSSWGGGDTTTRFAMTASFTTAEKGPVTVRVYAAKASATFYIDPKVVLA